MIIFIVESFADVKRSVFFSAILCLFVFFYFKYMIFKFDVISSEFYLSTIFYLLNEAKKLRKFSTFYFRLWPSVLKLCDVISSRNLFQNHNVFLKNAFHITSIYLSIYLNVFLSIYLSLLISICFCLCTCFLSLLFLSVCPYEC